MNIVVPKKFGCVYQAEVLNSAGEVVRSTAVSPNIITQFGLDFLGGRYGNYARNYICVGTGTSIPNLANTLLDAQVAKAGISSTSVTNQNTTKPYYIEVRGVTTFAVGAVVGNITEVGLCEYSDNRVVSRALLLDAAGDPTAITVLSDEQLRVTIAVREYIAEDFTGSFDLLDGQNNVIRTVNYVGNGSYNPASSANFAFSPITLTSLGGNSAAYNLNNLTENSTTWGIAISTAAEYNISTITVDGVYMRRCVGTFNISKGNGSWRGVSLTYIGAVTATYSTGIRFNFDSPIVKLNTQVLTLTLIIKPVDATALI